MKFLFRHPGKITRLFKIPFNILTTLFRCLDGIIVPRKGKRTRRRRKVVGNAFQEDVGSIYFGFLFQELSNGPSYSCLHTLSIAIALPVHRIANSTKCDKLLSTHLAEYSFARYDIVRTMGWGHCCHRYAPLLHCPIANPGSPRGNNQCTCHDGDLNPQPPLQRELVHVLACTTTATWTLSTGCYLRGIRRSQMGSVGLGTQGWSD